LNTGNAMFVAKNRKLVAVAVLAVLVFQAVLMGFEDLGVSGVVWHNSGIWIGEDGSVEPKSAPIRRVGNVYSFTEDVWSGIGVNRSDVVIDGNGYALKSNFYMGTGLVLSGVNNVTLQNLRVEYFSVGVYLDHSNGCVVKNSVFKSCGIDVKEYSQGNRVFGNDVEKSISVDRGDNNVVLGNEAGAISVSYSRNVTVSDNRMIGSRRLGVYTEGINVDNSADCEVLDNFVQNKTVGVNIWVSSNLTFTNNRLVDNQYGFKLWGSDLQTNLHRIDNSNTVNGKPVYFLVNRTDYKVPSNAGWIVAVNCRNITVENWVSTPNWDGLLFVDTQDSMVVGSSFNGNFNGVRFYRVSNTLLSGNVLSGNEYTGFYFEKTVSCVVSGNEVFGNFCFFNVWSGSSGSRVFGNDFVGNFTGYLEDGDQNFWDNAGKGNFWSLFTGVDFNGDGVSDIGFVIGADSNQTDNFPLMTPFFDRTREYVQVQAGGRVVLAIPEQYVNYTISSFEGTLWAKVEAVYPVHVISRTEAPLKMVYATPPNSTNIKVEVDGTEVAWSSIKEADREVFHNTSISIWQMIQYYVDSEKGDFLLKIKYDHPVRMANATSMFIFDLNSEFYLSSLSSRSNAHFRISFESNQSAIEVHALGSEGEWDRTTMYSSKNSPLQTAEFSVVSEYGGSRLVALAIELLDIQIPELSSVVIGFLVAAVSVMAIFFRKRLRLLV
jgi:parallel beta-helix repeat protein